MGLEEDFIVTVNDVRRTGRCVKGLRRWAELHGLDFRDFVTNGILASKLLATDDHLAFDIIEKIKRNR